MRHFQILLFGLLFAFGLTQPATADVTMRSPADCMSATEASLEARLFGLRLLALRSAIWDRGDLATEDDALVQAAIGQVENGLETLTTALADFHDLDMIGVCPDMSAVLAAWIPALNGIIHIKNAWSDLRAAIALMPVPTESNLMLPVEDHWQRLVYQKGALFGLFYEYAEHPGDACCQGRGED